MHHRTRDTIHKANKTIPYTFIKETLNSALLMEELKDIIIESEDITEWMKRCEGYETIGLLREELITACVNFLCFPLNTGLPLNQVAEHQCRRKLSLLKSSTKKALWHGCGVNYYA